MAHSRRAEVTTLTGQNEVGLWRLQAEQPADTHHDQRP